MEDIIDFDELEEALDCLIGHGYEEEGGGGGADGLEGNKVDESGEEEEEEEEEEEDEDAEDDDNEDEEEEDAIQPEQHSECMDYEALAEKKRKVLADRNGEDSRKKARREDMFGASSEEIEEALVFGHRCGRRKSRKPKTRGRRKGSRNKVRPEITKLLGKATLEYAHDKYEEALCTLKEVVKLGLKDHEAYLAFHTLGLVHDALGNSKKAIEHYKFAALMKPKDSTLWKMLFGRYMILGDMPRARKCLSKALRADPTDITMRVQDATFLEELGEYQKAAESYEEIVQSFPDDSDTIEALMKATELYLHCGQIEKSVDMLEKYIKSHPSEVNIAVINMLAVVLMETNAYDRALHCIENAHVLYYSGKDLPPQLKVKAGICHLYLGDAKEAELEFSVLEREGVLNHIGLIIEVADAFMDLQHFHLALKHYHMLESNVASDTESYIHLKIANCCLSLGEREKAVAYFHKVLSILNDHVEARLALASLMLEDAKEDEAIALLSPLQTSDSMLSHSDDEKRPWWLDGRIKLKLSNIYKAKGMLEDYVNTIFPLVRESLYLKTIRHKVKKRLTTSVLHKRSKILDCGGADDIIGGVRPLASRSDLSKATRARKLLRKKEEEKAAAKAAGFEWNSDNSDDESLEEVRVPPLSNFLNKQEDYDLIIDLCKALQSLKRYLEALEIINLTRKLALEIIPSRAKEELQSLAAQISCKITDPKHGFQSVKANVLQHPYSFSAWNCYYKKTLRQEKRDKFLRRMRTKYSDCVPPIVISGHQFTIASHHQDAAREYLEAYKHLPESPLINLCVGSALINLALGFRLQNKHQCIAQGLAFLYNNLRLAENKQEAFYNIARAYHHVGMVTLATTYYEKVLATRQEDYPIPKLLDENTDVSENLGAGYCDLRREAAYNLHLIYKRSGAFDLARQVLKDHCSF